MSSVGPTVRGCKQRMPPHRAYRVVRAGNGTIPSRIRQLRLRPVRVLRLPVDAYQHRSVSS